MTELNDTSPNPRHISGYRELDDATVDVINLIKEAENTVGDLIDELRNGGEDIDPRALALARTHLQEGFMWAVRSITQPESRL